MIIINVSGLAAVGLYYYIAVLLIFKVSLPSVLLIVVIIHVSGLAAVALYYYILLILIFKVSLPSVYIIF